VTNRRHHRRQVRISLRGCGDDEMIGLEQEEEEEEEEEEVEEVEEVEEEG
jgi:hypothetical protein